MPWNGPPAQGTSDVGSPAGAQSTYSFGDGTEGGPSPVSSPVPSYSPNAYADAYWAGQPRPLASPHGSWQGVPSPHGSWPPGASWPPGSIPMGSWPPTAPSLHGWPPEQPPPPWYPAPHGYEYPPRPMQHPGPSSTSSANTTPREGAPSTAGNAGSPRDEVVQRRHRRHTKGTFDTSRAEPVDSIWRLRSQELLQCVANANAENARKEAENVALRRKLKALEAQMTRAELMIQTQQDNIDELEQVAVAPSQVAATPALPPPAAPPILFDMGATATTDLSTNLSANEVALNMAMRASGLVECCCCAIFTLQYNYKVPPVLLRVRYTQEGGQPQTPLSMDEGLAAKCVSQNSVLQVPELPHEAGFSMNCDGATRGPALYVPLHVSGVENAETWGCVAVYRDASAPSFDVDDLADLQAYASSCCVTFAGRQLQTLAQSNIRAILSTATSLLSTPDFQADGSDVVEKVQRLGAQIFRAEYCFLHRVKLSPDGTRELVHTDRNGKEVRCAADAGLVGECATEGQVIVSESPRFQNKRFDDKADGLGSAVDIASPRSRSHTQRIRSVMNCPIWHMEMSHGVMAVCQVINKGSSEKDKFTQSDQTLADFFCAQMSFVLEQKRLVRRLAVAMDAGLDIHRDSFTPGNLERFMETCFQVLDSTTGAFFIFDEDLFKLLRKTLITSAHDNQLIRMIHRGGSPAEEQVTSLVKSGLKTRASDASSFVDKALHGALQRQGLRNCCCTLLHNRANGQIVGVVQVGNKIHGSYLHEDEQVLEALAAQAEVCFENYGLQHDTLSRAEDLDSILKSLSKSSLVLSMDENHVLTSTNCVDDVTFIGDLSSYIGDIRVHSFDDFLYQHNHELYTEYLAVSETAKPYNCVNIDFKTPDGRTKHVNCGIMPRMSVQNMPVRDRTDSMTRVKGGLSRTTSSAMMKPAAPAPAQNKGRRGHDMYGSTRDMVTGVVLVLEDISNSKRMMSTLSRYMSPDVASKLLSDEGALTRLGGTQQKVTLLFSDIRGFSSISEGKEPGWVVNMLNGYFTHMIDVLYEQQGTLDKFIGDAVMAVFGVPTVRENDSFRACRCALRMMQRLDDFNAEFRAANEGREAGGDAPLLIGIGLNTGSVLSGNIGSEKRLEYTVIGDEVNLGSRLEGVTKKYGVDVIISESTYSEVNANFVCRELDLIRVMGKKEPVRIFELVCEESGRAALDPQQQLVLAQFPGALAAFRSRRWVEAREQFEVLATEADDKTSKLFMGRCDIFSKQNPGADWIGVTDMDSK